MHGLHIIGDCYDCDFSYFIEKHDMAQIQAVLSSVIKDSELTLLASNEHMFGENAYSFIYLLAESHVSVHTRPEEWYVSFDIFVCNYTSNNSTKAEYICEKFKEYFKPKKEKIQYISR